MAAHNTLTETQIRDAIRTGEFGAQILGSARNVAVIMSQSWCPQWHAVERWIQSLPDDPDLQIWTVVYDTETFFDDFLEFKETVFRNREVPYIRYYTDGRLIKETNYTSKDFFLKAFAK